MLFIDLNSAVIPKGELFDIVTPYGSGGWIIEEDNKEMLVVEYNQWAKRNHIVSEFVRFHPILRNYQDSTMDAIHLGDTVYMETESEQKIWANLSSKNRNTICKAIKADQ